MRRTSIAMDAEKLKYHREYNRKYREERRDHYRKLNREWIKNNQEKYNASKYAYRDRLKREIFLHYGDGKIECKRCGIEDIDVLCLDHINNDGAMRRKEMRIAGRGSRGLNTYEVLKREGRPTGIQILCANCNLKKEIELKREKRLKNRFYAANSDTASLHSTVLSDPVASSDG